MISDKTVYCTPFDTKGQRSAAKPRFVFQSQVVKFSACFSVSTAFHTLHSISPCDLCRIKTTLVHLAQSSSLHTFTIQKKPRAEQTPGSLIYQIPARNRPPNQCSHSGPFSCLLHSIKHTVIYDEPCLAGVAEWYEQKYTLYF